VTSNMPIENAAAEAAKASSGPQPVVDAAGNIPVSAPLPTAQELLEQVQAQQQAPQPTYTPTADETAVMNGDMTINKMRANAGLGPAPFDAAAQMALTKAMNRYVKGQTRFIHDQNLKMFATEMENHIIALTTALEQLGVL
jgi:hypothetical protein